MSGKNILTLKFYTIYLLLLINKIFLMFFFIQEGSKFPHIDMFKDVYVRPAMTPLGSFM